LFQFLVSFGDGDGQSSTIAPREILTLRLTYASGLAFVTIAVCVVNRRISLTLVTRGIRGNVSSLLQKSIAQQRVQRRKRQLFAPYANQGVEQWHPRRVKFGSVNEGILQQARTGSSVSGFLGRFHPCHGIVGLIDRVRRKITASDRVQLAAAQGRGCVS
jgi:hypothetical protein